MWQLSQPWWEFVLRGAIIYVFVFALLRISGTKRISQLSPLDLVLLLIISNAVQNSMNAGDNTVTAGLILAVTLVSINMLANYLIFKSRNIETLIEGQPKVIIHNGMIIESTVKSEKITRREIEEALREEGVTQINTVRYAILETDGKISIVKRGKSVEQDSE
jgi:uncharacterized membrane protein YcaP (DUF421 family)